MRRLSKTYGSGAKQTVALSDLNLSVNRGEIFGYLGPNGAGKTTTIRLLLDLIRPSRGSATIFGLDIRADSVEIHRRIGFLPRRAKLCGRAAPATRSSIMSPVCAATRGGS